MSKFKVGDKVIRVDYEGGWSEEIIVGQCYTVLQKENNYVNVLTSDEDGNGWLLGIRFELYEEKENKEMTAEQIRNEILRIDVRIEEARQDIENAKNERNSLVEKLREQGFSLTTNPQPIVRYSKGDKLIVVGNTTLHRFPNGTVVTVIEDSGNYYDCKDRGGMVWSCHDADVVKFK